MERHPSGATAPPLHPSFARTDRDATRARMSRKGFAILASNPDGSTDYYRILSFAVGDGGLRAWFRFGEDEIAAPYPIVGFAVILIARGGGKVIAPSIEAVIAPEGAPELACQTGGFLCLAASEDEARAVRGLPPRDGGRAS